MGSGETSASETRAILRRFAPDGLAGAAPQVQVARKRLGSIAVTLGAMTALTLPVRLLLVDDLVQYAPEHLRIVLASAGVALDVAMALACLKSSASDSTILRLAYVYAVLRAATLALTPMSSAGPPLLTWALVLVVLLPLVLPPADRRSTVAVCLASLTQPLAHALLASAGYSVTPSELLASAISGLVAAALGLIARDIVARYQVEAQRELGSYDLVSRLGRGGMGEVWAARHRFLARPAAIKLIPQMTKAGSAEVTKRIRRFRREAQVTANLTSPHTVAVFDFGVTEAGIYYYVMEQLRGVDLQELVSREGALSPGRAAFLIHQACDSLAEAHDAGLIHRDLKPSNIFVTRQGIEADFVKVLDFGLVGLQAPLLSQSIDVAITARNMMTGTPAYMSPEMVLGESIDGRADIYALGCVLFFLTTGQMVFPSLRGNTLALAHAHEAPRNPHELEPSLPDDFVELVLMCLAKRPDARPKSAEDLQIRLAALDCFSSWTRDARKSWWDRHFPREATDEMKDAVRRSEEEHTVSPH